MSLLLVSLGLPPPLILLLGVCLERRLELLPLASLHQPQPLKRLQRLQLVVCFVVLWLLCLELLIQRLVQLLHQR